ncbi:uncharacterized protein TRUGW13939_11201 [Talaromyces rugulosus]|uniref:Kelch repeat protein n=1 Tax=Talaromyces rugulosus TaxID=121627 RepID=A0A7H8RDG1_TALRU|nr:uncharacterized protein TRUGW13939_11201 [Talaromyces rugulosus]QKX64028.1 hypothetical protein TRUGW13939_11201 [Talaromyces rugulosus]
MAITVKCQKLLDAEILQRSSQVVSVVGNRAYIFGGELRPREPRDNGVHAVPLDDATASINTQPPASLSPSARVGTASATLNDKIYLFSGRGGVAMAPIEEQGAVWEYDPKTHTWFLIQPSTTKSAAVPAARSYHCMASDGKDTLYLHAGCPESGRLSDLWAFNVPRKEWTELAPAFDPPRGGTSIAFADGKLYRMNGFDGKTEQGGNLDIYTPETNSWDTHIYVPDGTHGPAPRSVGVLLPVSISGRPYLVTLFGERDPSSLGHQGAGKMLSDVWSFDIENKKWEHVNLHGGQVPVARGWFDADVAAANAIIVHGGLGESNNRLGDIWRLEFA